MILQMIVSLDALLADIPVVLAESDEEPAPVHEQPQAEPAHPSISRPKRPKQKKKKIQKRKH